MNYKPNIIKRPNVLNKLIKLEFSVSQILPYINWDYFYYAWQLPTSARKTKFGAIQAKKIYKEANTMLEKWGNENTNHLRCHVLLTEAIGSGEDIILPKVKTFLPMLRQQTKKHSNFEDKDFLCLSDFVRKNDYIGLFGCTMIRDLKEYSNDPYNHILSQTLADRLAEAATERMHEIIRKKHWGYAKNENLSIKDLLVEKYDGIRPAVGYPCISDTSINLRIGKIIDFNKLGIKVTENGAMIPHASVSGLIIANRESKYFSIGKIGEDQLIDYASRCNIPIDKIRPFLAANLL